MKLLMPHEASGSSAFTAATSYANSPKHGEETQKWLPSFTIYGAAEGQNKHGSFSDIRILNRQEPFRHCLSLPRFPTGTKQSVTPL